MRVQWGASIVTALLVVAAASRCSKEGESGTPWLPYNTPTPSPTATPSPAFCSLSCPWNSGSKRVVFGAATDCVPDGAESVPEYHVHQNGQTCPCTYDPVYDTSNMGAVGCSLSYPWSP